MPELPEVEIAARTLRRVALGRRVRSVHAETGAARLFRPDTARILQQLVGARFQNVDRLGKNLLVTLDRRGDDAVGVWSHLGMTGKWLVRAAGDAPPRFERVAVALEGGLRLSYVDLRLFGRLRLVRGAHFDQIPELHDLPPDPLAHGIDPLQLRERWARLRLPVKVALLDQRFVPGVGNIQASEGLWRARIDPRRSASSLSLVEVRRLARSLLKSFEFTLAMLARGGADGRGADVVYVEEDATRNPFRVYGRQGSPCPRGDRGFIERIVQTGRSTFFCPACQT